jgi:hypothetical protein
MGYIFGHRAIVLINLESHITAFSKLVSFIVSFSAAANIGIKKDIVFSEQRGDRGHGQSRG